MVFKAAGLGMTAIAACAFLAACTADSPDCTGEVGNSKKACEHDSKSSHSPDNANNPDQGN